MFGSGDSIGFDFNAWELSQAAQSIENVILNARLMAYEIFNSTSRALFRDMPKLVFLDLSKNTLIDLQPALFQNLSSLTCLDLSHNEMETIAQNAFIRLTSLETLNLSDNALFFFLMNFP